MKNFKTRTAKALLFALAATFTLTGAACSSTNPNEKLGSPEPFTVQYWTVFNESGNFEAITEAYKIQFPNINIEISTYRPEEYESQLINAFAEDRGPDIFSIPNTAVIKYLNKIEPMPAATSMEQGGVRGLVKKVNFTTTNQIPAISPRELRDRFVDQALADILVDNQVMGLPLALDTMVMYYNKDMLNAAGITKPATNYIELQEQMPKLTRTDRLGNILQSGIALGTSNNIPRFSDILSLLMMQNGTQMIADSGEAAFDILPQALAGRTSLPAADALQFYVDFALPTKQAYTWNDAQPNALEAFEQGKVAYLLGYSYHLPIIRAQSPKLNMGIAKMMQIPGNNEVNYANYWLEVVSKKSVRKDAAWNFLQFMTAPENVKNFLTSAKRPTAVRSLIDEQRGDLDLGVFADQLLTARSWYHGVAPEAVDSVFAEMIQSARDGIVPIPEILNDAVAKINQILR